MVESAPIGISCPVANGTRSVLHSRHERRMRESVQTDEEDDYGRA